MKSSLILTFCIILLIGFNESLWSLGAEKAKSNYVYFGVTIGYSQTQVKTTNLYFSEDCRYCFFNNAKGYTFSSGLVLEKGWKISEHFYEAFVIKPTYDMFSGNSVIRDSYPILVGDGNSIKMVNKVTEHELNLRRYLFSFEVLNKVKFLPYLPSIISGPSFSFAITRNDDQKDRIVSPENISFNILPSQEEMDKNHILRYEDNGRTIVYQENKELDGDIFRLGWVFGLQYDINVWRFKLSPGLYYNYGISTSNGSNMPINSYKADLDLMFCF